MTNPQQNDAAFSQQALTIREWRQVILQRVLQGGLIVWLLTVAGLLLYFGQNGVLAELPGVVYGLTAVLTIGLIYITRARKLNLSLRAGAMLIFLYALGTASLWLRGPTGNARIFYMTFVAMAAVFMDRRRSIAALIMTTLTTAVIFSLATFNLVRVPFSNLVEFPNILSWMTDLGVFLALNTALIISITYLIDSLEKTLESSLTEQKFVSAILETSGALVVLFDTDGRIVRFNRACEQLTGYTFAEVKHQMIWDLFLTAEGVALTKAVFEQIQAGETFSAYESFWLTRDGSRRLIAWTTTPLLDQNGRLEYIVSTGIDITEQKASEAERERLLIAERQQRLLAETLREVTLALTAQIHPADVLNEILRQVRRIVPYKAAHISLIEGENLRVASWQGYNTHGGEELVANLIQPIDRFAIDMEVIRSGQPIIITDTRQDPRWITLESTSWIRSHLVVPLRLQDRIIGLLRLDGDTPGEFSPQDAEKLQPIANAAAIALENARLHQEASRQAERTRQILDSVQEGILLLDANYAIQVANPAAQTYLQELAHSRPGDILTHLGPEPITNLLKPPPQGMLWHEITLKNPDRTFELIAQKLEADTPEQTGWVLLIRNVTESRRQQQYLQAQERLAMVGQLAAGIAHDFNNIMTVIILYAQMLVKSPHLPPDLQERMATIVRQAKLAANLIAQILDFSRRSVMERRPLNLVSFLKELVRMLKRTLPENINLHLDYHEGEYTLLADLTRLQQAIMNLAVNARDAMPDGGSLTIELTRFSLTDTEAPPLPDMPPGEWIRLVVADTGVGIPPENLPRVFDPFFTTKPPGQGTGLGLAQVYGIIKQHEGFIDVSSEPGKGTKFILYLPAAAHVEFIPEEPEMELVAEGGGETILVVEDDEVAREAICALLEMLNYRVVSAGDGEEALKIFRQRAKEISLVVSDMVMPRMNGAVLYERLRELRSDIKMVIISGYPFEDRDKLSLSEGIVKWLQKPFVMEQMVAAINAALSHESHKPVEGAS